MCWFFSFALTFFGVWNYQFVLLNFDWWPTMGKKFFSSYWWIIIEVDAENSWMHLFPVHHRKIKIENDILSIFFWLLNCLLFFYLALLSTDGTERANLYQQTTKRLWDLRVSHEMQNRMILHVKLQTALAQQARQHTYQYYVSTITFLT